MELNTAIEIRLLCRDNALPTFPSTTGLAMGHIQANLVVLPARYASDFRHLCQQNPIPCPLIGETLQGDPTKINSHLGAPLLFSQSVDIRTDLPKYNVYRNGKLIASPKDVKKYWSEESVGFLIGCSYSFEAALVRAGLPPRHHRTCTAVPMYRTSLPLKPSGIFSCGTYVVSMRPYRQSEVEKIRELTAPYELTGHGEPIAWGWNSVQVLGIKDISEPEWGVAVPFEEDEVPVFWGCGVTPQNCLLEMGDEIEGDIIAHYPGSMLLCDLKEEDVKHDI